MKDPKQKAIELFEKAKPMAHANIFSFREESFNNNCRKIALMSIDESIQNLTDILYKKPISDSGIIAIQSCIKYNEQVKQELEKM